MQTPKPHENKKKAIKFINFPNRSFFKRSALFEFLKTPKKERRASERKMLWTAKTKEVFWAFENCVFYRFISPHRRETQRSPWIHAFVFASTRPINILHSMEPMKRRIKKWTSAETHKKKRSITNKSERFPPRLLCVRRFFTGPRCALHCARFEAIESLSLAHRFTVQSLTLCMATSRALIFNCFN